MKTLPAHAFALALLLSAFPRPGTAEDTGAKAYNAVVALQDVGQFDQAEKAAQSLVDECTRGLGAEHPETLRARLLLAQNFSNQSRESEAEAQLRALLPLFARVAGAESRDCLACQSSLVSVLIERDKNSEAEELCRSLVPVQEKVLGATDPDTLKTRRLHAKALYALEKNDAAEQENREVLDLCQRRLGPDDRETLRARLAIATADLELDHAGAAETVLRDLLPRMVQVFGEEKVDTLICRHVLMRALRFQEKYDEVVQERRKWIVISTRLFGPADSNTLYSRMELAKDLDAQGRDADAEQERRAVLALQEEKLGAENKATLKTCHALALCLRKQKKTEEALTYARRALAGRIKVLGEDANDTDASQRLVNQLTYATPHGLAQQPGSLDRVVAMVDGALIHASEVQQTYDAQEQVIRYQYRDDPGRMAAELAELKQDALSSLIDKHLLMNEFRSIGGIVKPEYVDADVDEIVKQSFNGDRAALIKELEKGGMSFEKFRTLREQMVIMNVMRARFAGDIKVSDDEARDYYEKNKQLWRSPAQVKIHTLTLAKAEADAPARLAGIRKKIDAGADFATLARSHSQDSHAEDGGAWDWMPVTSLTDHVRHAAEHTLKGQLSAVIDQGTSLILLRVDDRRAAAVPAYEKVKDKATEALRQEKATKRIDNRLETLREKADIQKMGAV